MKIFQKITFIFLLSINIAWSQTLSGAKLTKIEWNDYFFQKQYQLYFQDLLNRPYDNLTFKIKIDQISKELFANGYLDSKITYDIKTVSSSQVAKIKIQASDRLNFKFLSPKIFTHQELNSKVVERVKNDLGKVDLNSLSSVINEAYEEKGYYGTKVTYYENSGLDLNKKKVRNVYFNISEGKKIPLESVTFRGNSFLSSDALNDILSRESSGLIEGKFYDQIFLNEFSNLLKREYLARGFVFVDVSKPRIINNEDKSISVEYIISEKQQVILRNINLTTVPTELQDKVKSALINQISKPINIIELENDLRKMIEVLQSEGYYFATISNLNSDNLISYDKSLSYIELNPAIKVDRKICYNETIVNGTLKTDIGVILREINLAPGELMTPAKLEFLRQKLSGLGLFASLRLTPYILYEDENSDCPKTNLVVQVSEKDFGLLEVAPGYRTDLGAKLSTGIIYNNLMGMNRSVSAKAQLNQRFNLDGFDRERQIDDKKLLEYSLKASFVEPYLLHNLLNTQIEFELSSSFQRIRFYGFDADIFRFSPQISKTFSKYLSTSVRYQFERIIQFDATEKKDNDNFSIGGVTPSISLDFRDDPTNPRKGAFLTLSSEWANPYFGSMKNDDLEVNFVKVINRNKFYYPLGNFTLAFSLAMGYEKNFATDVIGNYENGQIRTRGYIPSIKVFRLDGFDEIRGYDEGEINRLINGQPIGEVVVQKEAYFTAFKFEPRYNINDSLQVGIFFDAGRVFVNDFEPLNLRTSAGAGLKFLTPVGSLDFDYGFKLQRKTYSGMQRDSVGRFHLSIGFF